MDHITNALQGELRQALDRLRELGGAVVFEDYPGALEAGDDGEVGGDSVNASEERELSSPSGAALSSGPIGSPRRWTGCGRASTGPAVPTAPRGASVRVWHLRSR